MTGVRVLVGTRKGAFVLTADGSRRDWQVSGPHFAGWEIYHVAGSPADPIGTAHPAVRLPDQPSAPPVAVPRRAARPAVPVGVRP